MIHSLPARCENMTNADEQEWNKNLVNIDRLCTQSIVECVYLQSLTHPLFVQRSTSHFKSVCSKLSKCSSVSPHRFCNIRPQTSVSLAWKCFPFSLTLVLLKASLHCHHDHRGRKRQTVIIIIHGLYRPGSQIEGVVSTLQLWAEIHTHLTVISHHL